MASDKSKEEKQSINYRGDSPAKKIARLKFWLKVKEELGEERFVTGNHLVLASYEGGDISVLNALDVPFNNIYALDIDGAAIDKVKLKFPEANIYHGDIRKFKSKKKFVSIFLDLCATCGEASAGLIADVIKLHGKENSIVGCALMYGREKSNSYRLIKTVSSSLQQDFTDALYEEISRGPIGLPWQVRSNYDIDEIIDKKSLNLIKREATQLGRVAALGYLLMGELPKCKKGIIPCGHFAYQSSSSDSHGSPMVISLFKIIYRPEKSLKRFVKYYTKAATDHYNSTRGNGNYSITNVRANESTIKEAALQLMARGMGSKQISLGLNVPIGTVAAWKAHYTRGTY